MSSCGTAEVLPFRTGHLSRYDWDTLSQWTRALPDDGGAEFLVCSESRSDGVDVHHVVLRVRNHQFRTYVIYRPTDDARWVTVTPDAPEEGIIRETRSLRDALNAIRPALPELPCTVLQFQRRAA